MRVAMIAVKQVMTLQGKKKPLTPRAKSILWFMQAFGFWAIVIGAWIKLETILPDLISGETDDVDASVLTPGQSPTDLSRSPRA